MWCPRRQKAKNSGVPLTQIKPSVFIKAQLLLFFFSFPLKSRIKEDTMSFCNQLNKITEKLLTSFLTFPLSWNNLGQPLWLIMEKVRTSNHKKNVMPRLLIDFL